MPKAKLKYCSLDIETSGFDPLVCEVLEVGFAFFELNEGGVKITEEFTQVFKPAKEVSPSILGLTGITKQELDEAPPFSEYRDIIQNKLGDAVIVGHNVIFDIRFLESLGIKFSGQVIDTLDLVQFILPTHHSYNLENLMHSFHVSHKDAHRALADAKADLVILERLLQIYSGFPQELKRQIIKVVGPFGFSWQPLLEIELPAIKFVPPAKPAGVSAGQYGKLHLKKNKIYDFAAGEDFTAALITAVKKDKALLAVPTQQEVFQLWKAGLAQALFGPELLFDEQKFAAFLAKKDSTAEEARFLLKVLVWKHTNWQQQCVLDLNLSFFGGQFRDAITGGKSALSDQSLLCCSHEFLLSPDGQNLDKERLVIIKGLAEFEQQVSSMRTAKVSWGQVCYLLKTIYNPELDIGRLKLKPQVLDLLNATDLFFGLVSALFQTDPPGFQYVKVSQELVYSEKFGKIKAAADSYAKKLEEFGRQFGFEAVLRAAQNLQDFFSETAGFVAWMELAENRCGFYRAPVKVDDLTKAILKIFPKLLFADSLVGERILSYFVQRLGLKKFGIEKIAPELKLTAPKQLAMAQGELFAVRPRKLSLKKTIAAALGAGPRILAMDMPAAQKTVSYHCIARTAGNQELRDLLTPESLPAAVLLSGNLQTKEFYNEHYQALKQFAFVLSGFSGGSNKIFHNFSIHKESLLLATDKMILKFLNANSATEAVRHLAVKTLILCHLPFEQFTHPYQEAVASQFASGFMDYSLPRAVYNFHRLVQFFQSPALEKVYVIDAKLGKDYAQAFKDYLKSLPNSKVLEGE